MYADSEEHVNEQTIWKRGLYMLIFAFCLWLAKFVAFAVIIFQFFAVLFTGSVNGKLLAFGQSLSTYQYQVMLFLTFNSETHPYPLVDWPEGAPPCKHDNQTE
jgi:hypothetical protein